MISLKVRQGFENWYCLEHNGQHIEKSIKLFISTNFHKFNFWQHLVLLNHCIAIYQKALIKK